MGVGTSSQDQPQQSNHTADAFEPLLSDHGSTDSQAERPTYASIPVESRRQPRRRQQTSSINPFWVPPFKLSEGHYYIVKVPKHPKPRIVWRAPRPFVIYDYILSALFLYVAIRLIQPSRDDMSLRAIMSAVLFQAGLVTAVMSFYTIFRSCGRRCFQWQDIFTIIALGVSLYLNHTLKHPWKLPNMSKTGTWKVFVGISLLEAVAIYIISRGLFILPTKDDTIDMLKTEASSWECSVALGLTCDYFERVKQVAEIIKSAPGNRIQVSYQNPGESKDDDSTRMTDEMLVPCIFVALSRYADWSGGSPSPPKRQDLIRSGRLLACQVEGTGDSGDSWLCVTGMRQGYILDVSPQPLHTIMDDILANPTFQNDVDRKAQYQREVHRFSQRLAWLLKRAELDRYVKIIEFENNMMQHIPVACKDVFTQLQHADGAGRAGESRSDEEAGGADTTSSPYQTG